MQKLIPLVNLILESSNQIGLINMLKMRLFHQFAQEKSCNLIGWEDFGTYLRNKKDLCRNTANKNFLYRINTVLNFSSNSNNPIFGDFCPIYLIFGAKKVFPWNQVVMHNFFRVSGIMPKLRKIWWSNFKKTPRQMSGGMDGQTLFVRILPATTRGLTSKTAVNWHLEVKDIEYNVGLTKNYCITVSMQKISSIHKLIQQILGSHELHGHTQF